MARKPNTNRNGGNWTAQQKKSVWEKGMTIVGYSKDIWRRDKCGKNMRWSEHGNRNSTNGWEIDHIDPVSNSGDDALSNLQPLQWENNADKSDKLNWSCP